MTGPHAPPPPAHNPRLNHLLAALPADEYARLLPHLELIPMPLGWAVYESGGHMSYLYFPTTVIVSLLYVMEDGASAEIAIGRQRGHGRHLLVHGRRNHAQPGGGAKRRQWLPA